MVWVQDFYKSYSTHSMYEDFVTKKGEDEQREWSGTGFALNKDCIITNYHVVENSKCIKIRFIRQMLRSCEKNRDKRR